MIWKLQLISWRTIDHFIRIFLNITISFGNFMVNGIVKYILLDKLMQLIVNQIYLIWESLIIQFFLNIFFINQLSSNSLNFQSKRKINESIKYSGILSFSFLHLPKHILFQKKFIRNFFFFDQFLYKFFWIFYIVFFLQKFIQSSI